LYAINAIAKTINIIVSVLFIDIGFI